MKTPLLRGGVAAVISLVLCILAGALIPPVGQALGTSFMLSLIVFVLVAFGLWRWLPMPGLHNARSNQAPPLHMHQEGDWTIIATRSAPMPKRGPVIAILCPAPLGIFALSTGHTGGGLIVWAVITGLIFWWLHHVNKSKRHADLGPFAVSPDAVRLPDGTVIQRSRVYQYSTRNTEDGRILVYGSPSSVVRAGQIGAAATHQRMLGISYAVVVEHDGTFSWLAGGLTEELAHAVLEEVARERKTTEQLLAESMARVEAADRKAKASFDRAMKASHGQDGHPSQS